MREDIMATQALIMRFRGDAQRVTAARRDGARGEGGPC
jgi:hypothetical protein